MKKIITLLFATLFATAIYAAEITYRVASYNADTDDFVLEAWGEKPEGASAYFFNDYGATTGNRYNQIPQWISQANNGLANGCRKTTMCMATSPNR